MRSFEERKAEVLSRSETAIAKRKANINRIKAAAAILSVCLCIFVGYNAIDNALDAQKKGGAKYDPLKGPTHKWQGGSDKIFDKAAIAYIKQQYAEKHASESSHIDATVDDIIVCNYRGIINKTFVLMVNCKCESYSKEAHTEVVGGVTINYPDGRSYTVWNGNNFYTIAEAYEKSILNIEDIEKIASKQ